MTKTTDNDKRDRFNVLLGLALDHQQPSGACPDIESVAAWHDGMLDKKESDGVKAHVARCDYCHEIWLGLVEATGEANSVKIKDREPGWLKRLTSWQWALGGGGLATAIAASLAILVFAPLMQQAALDSGIDDSYRMFTASGVAGQVPEQWFFGAQKKSFEMFPEQAPDTTPPDLARQAFQAGVRAGITEAAQDRAFWDDVIRDLPESSGNCEKVSDISACQKAAKVLFASGRWAVLAYFACEAGMTDKPFWLAQTELLNRITKGLDAVESGQEYYALIEARKTTHKGGEAQICNLADALLGFGLEGTSIN